MRHMILTVALFAFAALAAHDPNVLTLSIRTVPSQMRFTAIVFAGLIASSAYAQTRSPCANKCVRQVCGPTVGAMRPCVCDSAVSKVNTCIHTECAAKERKAAYRAVHKDYCGWADSDE
ncbi:hypothetical protein GGG16DRAFT_104536 [Schizophyllum commune]